MTKLAIIHTSPATLEPLKALAAEMLPGSEVVNFVDDSILPQLAANGGNLADVRERLLQYARFAAEVGADVILNACSSVGEVVADMRHQVSQYGVPIVRIDEAMAEAAVQQVAPSPSPCIGVAATLATTLNPTLRLLQVKAAAASGKIQFQPLLIEGAYQKLMAGDKEGHDAALAEALTELAETTDVVVLAQASMARVLPRLPQPLRHKFLSSPRLGMARVQAVVAGQSE